MGSKSMGYVEVRPSKYKSELSGLTCSFFKNFPVLAVMAGTVLSMFRKQALLVSAKPLLCSSRRYMNTAAHADARVPSEESHEDAVTQALRILQTAPIAWNSSGSAAFDFRSEHFLPHRVPNQNSE